MAHSTAPSGKLRLFQRRAGGVVRIAQVHHVRRRFRQLRHEAVFRRAGQIDDARIGAVLVAAAAPGHHVRIHIDGIDRIGHGHGAVRRKQLLNVAHVALGTVGYEDLVGRDIHAPAGIVALPDGFAQKIVAVFRPIAAEGRLVPHLVHGLMHRGDHRRHERPRHIPDAHADQIRLRVRLLERGNALADLGKQVVALQQAVVAIGLEHNMPPLIDSVLPSLSHKPTGCKRRTDSRRPARSTCFRRMTAARRGGRRALCRIGTVCAEWRARKAVRAFAQSELFDRRVFL